MWSKSFALKELISNLTNSRSSRIRNSPGQSKIVVKIARWGPKTYEVQRMALVKYNITLPVHIPVIHSYDPHYSGKIHSDLMENQLNHYPCHHHNHHLQGHRHLTVKILKTFSFHGAKRTALVNKQNLTLENHNKRTDSNKENIRSQIKKSA